MSDPDFFHDIISDHVKVVLELPTEEINDLAADIQETLRRGGKVIFFGNGGSATQAAHWAEEFVGRFVKKRKPLACLALGTSSANLTGIANDFGFDEVFARELEVLGNKKDLAIGVSTSGNSPNILNGLQTAKKKGIKSWILTGKSKNKAKKLADKSLSVASDKTARIQEIHALVIHMVCEKIDEKVKAN
ncbi:MAG: SIS domain-containing protein [Candidatus Curtissbacteria bacterium]|nr:SIS domain-containing protein [Candidatus Curtissbacteria bacterium]